jgi:hypothetical protein
MPNRHPYLPDAGAFAGWSSALAAFDGWPEVDVLWFTRDEERRIMAFPLPGEDRRKYTSAATYYPRRPVESPARWFADHAARLRGLELAEGMR